MTIRELPAVDWLGYGIDLSRSPTMDLRAALFSVLKGRRIISFNLDDNLRQVDIDDVVYDVPQAVRISREPLSQGTFVSYATGTDVQKTFRADAGLPARYLAVTGTDAAIVLAQDRSFIREYQYAFYSFTHFVYAARLADYDDLLNESALLRGVEDLPQRFNGDDERVLDAYKSFFQRFGSHVIVNANYGARFQLNAWASNDNGSVNAKFNTDVKAYFNGIPNGGQYDERVKSEAQYKVFLEYLQRIVTVIGGDSKLSSNLTSDPTRWATYAQWSDTVYTGTPTNISFHTTAIWSLMSAFTNDTLKSYAESLNQAFTWILTHPRVYKTAVVFDIQSDWAEFNLLTPNATILPDDANPYPANTVASLTRVQWGKEHSHDYEMQTLRFFVVNDGCPIDFSISHGTHGAGWRQGRAEVLIENERYLNDVITDDVWNTEWYFRAPVSATSEKLRLNNRGSGYSWDDIMGAYLRTVAGAATAEE
ncbi:MAC/Perforin domain-containing protein [Boletus edulis BED1]|uniref:MAC/Perforin domain-containing protein n=1 Tax=Boletus edulis BED1 TaxID=1328754 RepID=A0AAD4BN25_BOLED|nr:MAC/Perforin domain-containing protein [Boletus edulis BED1]